MASRPCTSESETLKLNVNALGCNGNTPLHEAVKRVHCYNPEDAHKLDEKHIQYIKLLLKFNPDVNVKNTKGYTPLHLAVKSERSVRVIKALTQDSEHVFIDVDSINLKGNAAIHEIPHYSNDEDAVQVLTFLLKLNVAINIRNSRDETILHVAIKQNSSDFLLKEIVNHGANLNTTDMKNSEGYTQLHLAVKNQRSLNVLEALTKDTENVFMEIDSVNKNGDATIHQVLDYSNSEDAVKVLALLMKLKADINKRNAKDETILYMAIQKSPHDIIKAIIDHGADLNATDEHGRTALYHAVFPSTSNYDGNKGRFTFRFRDVALVQHLVVKGSKLDIAAKNGYSPLLLAVVMKKTDYVKAMLEEGSDLAEGGLEQTASTFLVEKEYYICGRYSRLCTALYPSDEYHNMTPLLISVYDCNTEMTQMLITKGASVNVVNARGENALHVLMKRPGKNQRQGQIAKLLIENGIDLNAKDESGGTALNYAINNDKHEIVVYMLERGLDKL